MELAGSPSISIYEKPSLPGTRMALAALERLLNPPGRNAQNSAKLSLAQAGSALALEVRRFVIPALAARLAQQPQVRDDDPCGDATPPV